MVLWRLCQSRHAATAFSGEGSQLWAGRWHRAGIPVVYLSSSLSLAALECLAHFEAVLDPGSFVSFRVEVPERTSKETVSVGDLPAGWREHPAPEVLRDLGTKWFTSRRTVLLGVPSALIPEEFNWLLNPGDPDFERLRVNGPVPFAFDPRLWRS